MVAVFKSTINRPATNPERARDADSGLAASDSCSNFGYLLRGEHDHATFVGAVAHVIEIGSDKQMTRPDASSVVASMQHEKSIRDLADFECVGDAVYAVYLAATDPEITVTVSAKCASPLPTTTKVNCFGSYSAALIDSRPKSFCDGKLMTTHMKHCTTSATKENAS